MKLTFKNVFLSVGMFVFALGMFGFVSVSKADAFACTAIASTAWNVETTWSACGASGPVTGDAVTIPTGFNVTISGADAVATTLTLSGTSSLTSTTNALTVAGDTVIGVGSTLSPAGGAFTTGTLSVSGILTLGTGAFTAGTTTIVSGGLITLSGTSGQKTFSGTFTNNGTYNETAVNGTGITFSNTLTNNGTFTTSIGALHTFSNTITNTGTFNNAVPGSSMTNLAASTVGTFNYTGGAQTVQLVNYYNLGLNSTGANPQIKTSGVFTVLHALDISGGAQASLTGASTANSLTFNGSAKAKGTWGSNSSIATHKDNTFFAGTGTVAIATGSTGTSTVTITTDPSPNTYTDTTAPSGTSVSINAGVSTTSALSSTLTFTAIDATEMMISNDSGFAGASWESYAGSKAWTLTSGDGVKTVYARFRDATGNMSIAVIDAITVSGSGTVAVPLNEPIQGCSAGNLFNTSTGAVCVNNAVIPQGCSGGNAFNTSTGAVCTNNTTLQIPGCGNSTTGFSTSTGGSCAGNHVTTSTTTTYNFGTLTLKNGSKGEAVKELQRFLNDKLSLGLVVDGKLGPKTIAVIKTWQKDNGLVSDGLVGAKTKAMMNK